MAAKGVSRVVTTVLSQKLRGGRLKSQFSHVIYRQFRVHVPSCSVQVETFQPEIILLNVRWYCRYALSYRNLEEMMAEGGLAWITASSIEGGYSTARNSISAVARSFI